MRIARTAVVFGLTLVLCVGLLAPPAAAADDGFTPLDRSTGVTLDDAPRTAGDVINGRRVRRGMHPYVTLVLLSTKRNGRVTHQCTGTMITRRHVLTAAHCLEGTTAAAVAPRATHVKQIRPRTLVPAKAGAIFPRYQPAKARNDVGLLLLRRAVKITPVPLAGKRDDGRLRPGTAARAVGWGVNDNTNWTASGALLFGQISLWGNGQCKALFGGLWAGGTMLCGGAPQTDVCVGDSGGPLLVRRGTRWIQHGITSFGDVDCLTGDASAYMRVSAYGPWIRKLTGLTLRR